MGDMITRQGVDNDSGGKERLASYLEVCNSYKKWSLRVIVSSAKLHLYVVAENRGNIFC